MRFKVIAVIQIGAAMAGILVGIGMAWFHCGYWSLVGMQLCTPAAAFVLTWSASRWRPQRPTRDSGTRSLLGFGANLTASSFVWSLARGLDGLLIGKVYGSASLGLYSRAQALLLRPVEQFLPPFEAVFVPTLSRLLVQPERYRRIVFQALEVVALVSFLFSGILLALANPLTLTVLGPKWESAGPIFAGFALVALYSPVASVAGCLLSSQGRGRDFLILSVVASSSAVVAFLAGLPFGPVGVALAYSASCLLIQLPVTFHLTGRTGPVRTQELWVRFFKQLPLFGVVFGATWLIRQLVTGSTPLVQLLICLPTGLVAGAAFAFVYAPSHRVVSSLIELLNEWRQSRIVVAR